MRFFTRTLAGTALMVAALSVSGCETTSGGSDTSSDTTTGDTGTPGDTSAPGDTATGDTNPGDTDSNTTEYFAVYVEDLWNGKCSTNGAHGADIDAVGLWNPDNDPANPDLVGWWAVVDFELNPNANDKCTPNPDYENADEAKGAPDGKLLTGYVSLYEGWIIGEFEAFAQVISGYELTVHEIGSEVGGVDEAYEVYVATDLDCVNSGADYRTTCMVLISDEASGQSTLPLSGF